MPSYRILRYMPPDQMMAADMLIRQSNSKVIDALKKQCSHLASLASVPSDTSILDDHLAWLRFYKPATGQEWFIVQITDTDFRCLYYSGEFSLRAYPMDILRMKEGLALDIYWLPRPIGHIKMFHRNCEESKKVINLPYATIMRKGKFTEIKF